MTLKLKDAALLRQQCYVDGEWRDADERRQARGEEPRDRRGARHGAAVRRRGDPARDRRGARRVSRLGRTHREGSRGAAAALARPDARQRRRSRDAHDRRAGQAARGVEGRDRLCGVLHRVVRRGRQAPVRRRHPRTPARQAHPRPATAGGRRRRDHALEFPRRDDHAQGRRRRSPPAAPSSASRRPRRRTRRSRWPSSRTAPAFRAACSTSSPAPASCDRRRDDVERRSSASSPSPARPRSARS